MRLFFLAFCLLAIAACQREESQEDLTHRTLRISILISTLPEVRSAASEAISKSPGGLSLSDGTTVIPEVAFEDDVTAQRSIATGKRKPHIWVTLHPSLADLSSFARSELGIGSINCKVLAKRSLFAKGTKLQEATKIFIGNPKHSLPALLALNEIQSPRSYAAIEYYPSELLVEKLPEESLVAHVTGAIQSGASALHQELALSICRTESTAFSTREKVATDLLFNQLATMQATGFTQLNSDDVVSPISIAEILKHWDAKRTKRNLVLMLDNSGSMRGGNHSLMKKETEAIEQTTNAFNSVRVFTYSTELRASDAKSSLTQIVNELALQGGSAIIDSTLEVLEQIDTHPTTLLIFADSSDTNSSRTQNALQRFKNAHPNSSLQIYGVALSKDAYATLQMITDMFNGVTIDGSDIDGTTEFIDAIS